MGPASPLILEGLPAGVPVSTASIAGELARRRHGYGRGGRQRFEADAFEIQAGVRHGRTLGSPVGDHDPERGVRDEVPRADGPRGRDGPGEAPDAPPAGARRPRGHPEVRVRRRAKRPGAGERAGDGGTGGRGRALQILPGRAGRRACSPTSCRSGRCASALARCPRPRISPPIDASPVRCCGRDGRRARWCRRSTGFERRRTASAGSSRSWPTACPPASAPTCSGIASSTPAWPPR